MTQRDAQPNEGNAEQDPRVTRIISGGNEEDYDTLTGKSIGEVRVIMKDVLNIPEGATALLDGRPTDDRTVLTGGQDLEFRQEVGTNA